MAVNKKARKSGAASTPKKKASAPQRAQSRAQAQEHLPEVHAPRSHKIVDQSRFPGETPLTGEDRPSDRPRGKQQGYAQDLKPVGRGGRGGARTPVHPGEQSIRRARDIRRSGNTR